LSLNLHQLQIWIYCVNSEVSFVQCSLGTYINAHWRLQQAERSKTSNHCCILFQEEKLLFVWSWLSRERESSTANKCQVMWCWSYWWFFTEGYIIQQNWLRQEKNMYVLSLHFSIRDHHKRFSTSWIYANILNCVT
jgi:glucan-binding YG repeat protein